MSSAKKLFFTISLIFLIACEDRYYQDCNGIVNGGAYYDNCGVCVGGKTGLTECIVDCNGQLGGTAYLNQCELCVEGDTDIPEDSCSNLNFNGYSYNTVIIGQQVWLTEDLKTDQFNDGSTIPDYNSEFIDSSGTKYVTNSEDSENKTFYYSAKALNKLAPNGWRIPTKVDIESLIIELGGDSIAGGKLKEAGYNSWDFPNQFATNEVGFTALGKGYRNNKGNLVDARKRYSFWTQDTSSVIDSNETYYWTLKLSFDSNNSLLAPDSSRLGHSVRLIKDH